MSKQWLSGPTSEAGRFWDDSFTWDHLQMITEGSEKFWNTGFHQFVRGSQMSPL